MTYAELIKYFTDREIISTDSINMKVTLGSGETISIEEYDRRWAIQDRANMEWNQSILDLHNGLGGSVTIPIVIGGV